MRAVVIGASVAGLLAAAAIRHVFDEVVLLERDILPVGEELRPGVPQAGSCHFLLYPGAAAMDELVPGFVDLIVRDGARHVNIGETLILSRDGVSIPGRRMGMPVTLASRNFLETRLRARVREMAGITIRDGATVTGLVGDTRRVVGVSVAAGTPDPGTATLTADLVIDAGGRTSRSARWLTELGHPAVRERVVDSGQSYATAWLPASSRETITYEIGRLAVSGTAAAVAPIQNGLRQVLVFGRAEHRPSTDPVELADRLREYGCPALTEAADEFTEDTPVHGYAKLINRRRLYHRMRSWPQRYLIVGDALCMFNPTYGQGMSVAAREALVLHRRIDRLAANPARTRAVQRRIARETDYPWLVATAQDARFTEHPSVLGPLVDTLVGRTTDRLADNPHLHRALLQVYELRLPTALTHPTAWHALLRRRSPRRSPGA
ncbi:FAD-dependent oxidoreductase [Embleya hyalina]|uniref:Hydroxylase n=1 Tax=Embleya hyalina TaxID=516124 RepID=A0A401YM42_9ACTN|nr:FAD-dependent monooxygenase [Embleya hyalina]GCD95680.1 hydroxylase [Embleya hyalina]